MLLPFLSILVLIQLVSSKCNVSNALTPQQNQKYIAFTSASYVQYGQEYSILQAYSSLNRRLDDYLIQLQEQHYLFRVNDIQVCTNIPEYITYNSMDDVWICMRKPVMILECNKEWELKIGCGTFIELHRPFDTQVIGKVLLSESLISQVFSMTLVNVCAGTYHLWLVYSTRIGKVIKFVKPIFVSYPNCRCT